MKRKLTYVLLSTALSVCLVTACSCSEATVPETNQTAEKEFTIHYLTAKSMEEGAVKSIVKIADMYQKEHPGFRFEVESIEDRTAYLQKLKILASNDALPEWFDSDADSFFSNLAREGQVADIDALYEELGVTDKIFQNAKEYQRLEDGFLGLICWQGNTEYFWYNKKSFEKAGITQTPKTFEELLDACERLEEAGVIPISVAGGVTWPLLRYLAFLPFRRTGNDFIEQARRGQTSFGSPVGLEAADFMVRIGQYFQPGWSTADSAAAIELVISGEAAITYDGTWRVPYFVDENKELKEEIGYFQLPALDSEDVTGAGDYWAHAGVGTAIRKDAMDDHMKEFLEFVFSYYPAVSLYEYDTIPSIMPEIRKELSGFYKELIYNYAHVNTYAYIWDVRVDSASNEVLGRETLNLALGNITAGEWAERMDQAVREHVQGTLDQ